MKIADNCFLSGSLKLRLFRNGKLIENFERHNLIVQKAKETMAHLIGGDGTKKAITKVAFGTNGAEPDPANTAITDPYVRNIDGVSYPQSGQVTFHFSLGSEEANGKKILEFGLLCDNGDLFARRIRTEVLNKASDITVTGEWTISF